MADEQTFVEDDGLAIPDVGSWALDKYSMVGLYSKLFATGMKYKWQQRVYLDLYAASGLSRIRGTRKIVLGSPLIALTLPDRFDKYIFCEEDPELLNALRNSLCEART